MSVTLNQARETLKNKGIEALADLITDPNTPDEVLVFSFFYVPQVVESNPAWILTKMSGSVGTIASSIFTREDVRNYQSLELSQNNEVVEMILQLLSEIGIHQFKDAALGMLHVLAHGNDELNELLDDAAPDGGVFGGVLVQPDFVRAVEWSRDANSPKVDKLVNNPMLDMVKLLALYVGFPERAVHNAGWNILKHMSPKDIAELVSNKDIYFDGVKLDRTFKTADEWLDYANFLMPIADEIMADPTSDGGDHDLGYPIYYRLIASIKANPEEFSEEKIISGITDPKHVNHIKRIFADIDK